MAATAIIAATYTAVSLALAPISFGQVQVRVAETLTMLCVFNPCAIWGVTLGCFLTNLIGMSMGANVLGIADVVIGTGATLFAAIATAWLGRVRWAGLAIPSSIPPVIINGLFIGFELFFFTMPEHSSFIVFLGMAGAVALGEAISCMILGVLLVKTLERTKVSKILEEI